MLVPPLSIIHLARVDFVIWFAMCASMQVIDNIFKEFHAPKGSFRAHVVTLMTGTVIAQAISILISPFLTRVYSPADFGVFAAFTSLVSIVGILANGRFELAIMLPDNDDDAINILALSIFICFVISGATYLVVRFFRPQLVGLLGNSDISNWLYLAPLSVLLAGLYQSFSYWVSRSKQYKCLSFSRISQAIASAVLNLILGMAGYGVAGLIWANLAGQSISSTLLILQAKKDGLGTRKVVTKRRIKHNALKYRDFPLINTWHALMDSVQANGVVFIISYFFGSSSLGLYSLTLRALRIPISLIGSSVSQVFYQRASEVYSNGGDLNKLVRKTMIRLAIIALPIFISIFFFAPWAFGVIFGKGWHPAGVYARILSPWLLLNFIVSPVSQIPIIVRNQKAGFIASFLCQSIPISTLFLTGYIGKGIDFALFAFSISGSIALLLYIFWILFISLDYKRSEGGVRENSYSRSSILRS